MRAAFKGLLLSGLFVLMAAASWAQRLVVDAPTVVGVGETFKVEFSFGSKPESFKQPTFSNFNVIAGPTFSYGDNIQIVNGDVTRTATYTYTYVLQGTAAGKGTISSATVTAGGKNYTSRAMTIDIVAESGGPRQSQGGGNSAQGAAKATIAPDDILIGASVSRNNVYKGQPVKLTLKIYKRVSISNVGGTKLPAFNGFWSQELPQNPNRQWQRETVGQKVYDAMVLGEYLLYPQQSGTLQIEPFEITATTQIITQSPRSQSVLDDMLGGGPQVQEVNKQLRSKPIQVTVRDLPGGAPASFSGAVGNFTIDGGVSSRTFPANSSATYTVKISGTGNLPLIQAPKVVLPASFEQYNSKTTESLSNTASGTSGYRQFEYPFIARAEGTYPVDTLEFSYFNPETSRYVTLMIPSVDLVVTPDKGGNTGTAGAGAGIVSGLTREEIKVLGSDIRFIKLCSPNLSSRAFILLGSGWYFGAVLLMFALFAIAYVLLQKHIKQRGNLVAMKGKRANKVALQRFRAAEKHKAEGDRRRFLDEMLKALWGYMGDKLNIPAANLTKDNVREEFAKHGVSPQHTERYIEVISACELAQYSPETSGQADELYAAGVEVISNMESLLK